jgi:hypothetical protein
MIRDLILESFPILEQDDVRSTAMGQSGEDIQLSPAARKVFPYAVECKNQEKISLWSWWEQACSNAKSFQPLLFIKSNRKKPVVVVDAEYFFELLRNRDENQPEGN